MKTKKVRGFKYCFPKTPELEQFCNSYHSAMSEMNEVLHNTIFTGKNPLNEFHEIKTPKKYKIQAMSSEIYWNKGNGHIVSPGQADEQAKQYFDAYTVENGYCLPNTTWQALTAIAIKHGFSAKTKHFVKSMATMILDQYKGRNTRHGGFKRLNFKSDRAIRIPRGIIKDHHPTERDGKLELRHYFDDPMVLDYEGLASEKCKEEVNFKNLGGNMVMHKHNVIFTVRRTGRIEWAYKPVTHIAFDINHDEKSFITFDDGYKIAQPCEHLIRKLRQCTKKRNEKKKTVAKRKVRHQQRRYWNNKAIKIHKKMSRLYYPVAKEIVDRAEGRQAILCIDTLRGKFGSFGHDHIIKTVVKMCQDRGIPHCEVPPFYTSKTCHECHSVFGGGFGKFGYIDKNVGRISTDIFKCGNPKCILFTIQQDAQINAAQNILYSGKNQAKLTDF